MDETKPPGVATGSRHALSSRPLRQPPSGFDATRADVAQRQSSCFVNSRSSVQIRASAHPFMQNLVVARRVGMSLFLVADTPFTAPNSPGPRSLVGVVKTRVVKGGSATATMSG